MLALGCRVLVVIVSCGVAFCLSVIVPSLLYFLCGGVSSSVIASVSEVVE